MRQFQEGVLRAHLKYFNLVAHAHCAEKSLPQKSERSRKAEAEVEGQAVLSPWFLALTCPNHHPLSTDNFSLS